MTAVEFCWCKEQEELFEGERLKRMTLAQVKESEWNGLRKFNELRFAKGGQSSNPGFTPSSARDSNRSRDCSLEPIQVSMLECLW